MRLKNMLLLATELPAVGKSSNSATISNPGAELLLLPLLLEETDVSIVRKTHVRDEDDEEVIGGDNGAGIPNNSASQHKNEELL